MIDKRSAVMTGLALCLVQVLPVFRTPACAQQTTAQMLISSGFNPKAATTPELTKRLMALPPHKFVQRTKGGRTFYVYADASGCNCAFVGSGAAMDSYRANFQALPMDALTSGGFTNPEQNIVNSMENDDEEGQFNTDAFDPGF
jgi:hypothetical protein